MMFEIKVNLNCSDLLLKEGQKKSFTCPKSPVHVLLSRFYLDNLDKRTWTALKDWLVFCNPNFFLQISFSGSNMKKRSRFKIGNTVERLKNKVDIVIIKCGWSNLPRVDPPMRAAEGM